MVVSPVLSGFALGVHAHFLSYICVLYLIYFIFYIAILLPDYSYRKQQDLTPISDLSCPILPPISRPLHMEIKKVTKAPQSLVTCCKIRAYET